VPCLLAANELDTLRELLPHTFAVRALNDAACRAQFEKVMAHMPADFFPLSPTPSGYFLASHATMLLQARAIVALLEPRVDEAALRSWLPPVEQLIHLAKFEAGWDMMGLVGGSHPSLACAALFGRLGDWAAAAAVAEGVLAVALNPFVRVEALRLLGKSRAATGERAAACEAAERAVTEAAGAQYVWMEFRALRDLQTWCELPAAEAVRARLEEVAGRMVATPAELSAAFGSVQSVERE